MNLKNRRFLPDCTPLCLAMYMDVHKEGTGHLYPFLGEERGKKLQRHLTNFLLEQYYRHFWVFGCTSFVHIPAQLREKLSPRKPLVSFLDMLSPGIDAMTWNPRDSMYPWMFSLMGALPIFLNLINKPRGRMMMEMYCGLLPFINSNRILLQLMLRISLTLQAALLSIFCRLSACSADLRGFRSPGTACLFSAAITVSFPGSDYSIRSAV